MADVGDETLEVHLSFLVFSPYALTFKLSLEKLS